MIRETSLNLCKEPPETQTKALEALQAAVMELLVVVLVEQAPQVEAMELLLHQVLGAGVAMEEEAQLAVDTELPLVAADRQDILVAADRQDILVAVDRQDMLAATLAVNPPAADTDLPVVVDPGEGRGDPTEAVDRLDTPVDRLDIPVETLAVNPPAAVMDLLAVVEDRGELDPAVDRLDTPVATLPASLLRVGTELRPLEVTATVVEWLLKVVTLLLLVGLLATEPKLVIRGGGEGEAGMEGKGGGMEEREEREERVGEEGMEGV